MITVRGSFGGGAPGPSCIEVIISSESAGGGEYRYTNCKGNDSGWISLQPSQSVKTCILSGSIQYTGSITVMILGPC
jgi:hypothetical protein